MRKISPKRREEIMNNFLDTMDMSLSCLDNIRNAVNDGRLYNWPQGMLTNLTRKIAARYMIQAKIYRGIKLTFTEAT